MKKIMFSAMLTVIAVASVSQGASKRMYCKEDLKDFSTCKNIPENRRDELGREVDGGNPVAITNEDGNLKVWYTVGGAKLKDCQITDKVKLFKMSAHSQDKSTAYFVRQDGDLYDVKMSGSVSASNCPKASKQDYFTTLINQSRISSLRDDEVIELKVNPNSKADIIAVAATKKGGLIKVRAEDFSYEHVGNSAHDKLQSIIGN